MKPRYTKRVREEAALIASIGACSGSEALDCFVNEPAYELYFKAWSYALHAIDGAEYDSLDPMLDAEAHALLEDGWTP